MILDILKETVLIGLDAFTVGLDQVDQDLARCKSIQVIKGQVQGGKCKTCPSDS